MKRLLFFLTACTQSLLGMNLVEEANNTMTRDLAIQFAETLPIAIFPSSPIMIAEEANFLLAENANEGITIDADNVTINLGGFTVSNGSGIGIEIMPGHKNITIIDGFISNCTSEGILLHENCKNIVIKRVGINSTGAEFALRSEGTESNPNENILIKKVNIVDVKSGIRFAFTKDSQLSFNNIQKCIDTNCRGIQVIGSTIQPANNNQIINCTIQSLLGNGGHARAFDLHFVDNLLMKLNTVTDVQSNDETTAYRIADTRCAQIDFLYSCTLISDNDAYGIHLLRVENGILQSTESSLNQSITTTGVGFMLEDCSNISLNQCTALENSSYGFSLIATNSCCIQNSIAIGNQNAGFLFDANSMANLVIKNEAVNNGIGFSDENLSESNIFSDNVTNQNISNYSGITNTAGTTDLTRLGVNIDPSA